MFFVDDDQPQVVEPDVILQQFVGADDDIQFALLKLFQRGFGFLGAAEAAHDLNLDRPVGKTVAETVVVLLGQQGGGRQHRHLFAAVYGNKGRTHGDFGFAKANIAADQPVHRGAGQHVTAHRINGQLLVGGFFVGEGGAEGGIVSAWVAKGMTLARGTAGINIQQLGGHIAHLFGGLAFGFAPLVRAQAVQRGTVVIAAAVAGNQVQVGDRYIEFGLLGIFQLQKLGGLTINGQGGEPPVAADSMVDVHHGCTFAQFGQVTDDQFAGVFAGFVAALALADALTKQGAFRDHCQCIQQQAFGQRGDTDAKRFVAGEKLRPASDFMGCELDALQQLQQNFASSGCFCSKQDATIKAFGERLQTGQRLVSAGIQGQDGQRGSGQVGAANSGLRGLAVQLDARVLLNAGKKIFDGQVQLGWWQQGALNIAAQVFVAAAHILPKAVGRLFDTGQGK